MGRLLIIWIARPTRVDAAVDTLDLAGLCDLAHWGASFSQRRSMPGYPTAA